MGTLSKGQLFPEKVVAGMFNKVKGKSTLARFSEQMPVAFTGNQIFTFSLDKELNVVGENEAKETGGATVAPVHVVPIKLEYGARVSDEFLYASEEDKLGLLENFAEGFSKKLAKAIDVIGMHGLNPRTNVAIPGVTAIIDNSTVISQGSKAINEALEDAVAAIGDYDVTGIAVSKAAAAEIANAETTKGNKVYPDFKAWGKSNSQINGVDVDVNNTVAVTSSSGTPDKAVVGDFSAFKWGYAKDISFEVIRYGNPDNDAVAGDLAGHNQVYLRSEVYIGVAVLDASAFAVITA